MFNSTWESSKVALEISNYLDILDSALLGMDGGQWYEGLDETKKAILNSMQIAICDLHVSAAASWVNGTLIRRDKVLAKLGGHLSADAKQTLREAPFADDQLLN